MAKDTGRETFKRLLRIIEALPQKVPDDKPLIEVIPGSWPTVGDLRKLIEK